ncbi:hypothetical protein G4B88_028519 [Cannabis sativa]|uniref:Reverse transcriptase zinc-binding domain-containing protein n=1 Tax=Cannabis sativa TaxID=3483 RepID=A0A7J6GND5_CANSA|nr:hypothetical protein G4B88_028519 [Cannabis sativa]
MISESPFNEQTSEYGVQHLHQPRTTPVGCYMTQTPQNSPVNRAHSVANSHLTFSAWPSNEHVVDLGSPPVRSTVPVPFLTTLGSNGPMHNVASALEQAVGAAAISPAPIVATTVTSEVIGHTVPVSQAFATIMVDLNPSQPLHFAIGSSSSPATASTSTRKYRSKRPENGFDECLRKAWTSSSHMNNCDPIINITKRLEQCSSHLRQWKKTLGPSLKSKIRDTQSHLKTVQTQSLSDLITSSHQWNTSRIDTIFPTDISQAIQSIPLIRITSPDTYYWPFTSHGNYTANSGYHQAHSLNHKHDPSPSSTLNNQTWWKTLWTQPIPSKTKHFIWRAYYDILPTGSNLHKRKTLSTPACCRCYNQTESLEHALFRCETVQKIWHCRNEFLHYWRVVAPASQIHTATDFLEQYQQHNIHQSSFKTSMVAATLNSEAPSIFQLKLSVDAAQNVAANKTSLGFALYNTHGDLMLTVASPWNGTQSALCAAAADCGSGPSEMFTSRAVFARC